MQGARILVTGGAGFVGSHTVETLLARGSRVVVFDNFSSGRRENLPGRHRRLRVITGDVLDLAALETAMRGADACLHLAAQVSVKASLAQPQFSLDTNVKGFLNMLECARRQKLKRLVYASSAAIYGDSRQLPVSEKLPTNPISPYGLEKVTTERYAALYARLYGLSALGLRYFNIYGTRQPPSSPYSGVITKFSHSFAENQRPQIFGDGRQSRDFIYVKDVAAANAAALHSSAEGVCNIGTGHSINLLQLLRELRAITGKSLRPVFGPRATGDIRHSRADVRQAKRMLGFSAEYDFSRGLKDFMQ